MVDSDNGLVSAGNQSLSKQIMNNFYDAICQNNQVQPKVHEQTSLVAGTWQGWEGTRISEQGKSEGLDSCDRPSNLTHIGFKSSNLQPVWPWNLKDNLKKQ